MCHLFHVFVPESYIYIYISIYIYIYIYASPQQWTFPNQLVRLPLWKITTENRGNDQIRSLVPDLFGGCLPSHGWVARWSYQQGSVSPGWVIRVEGWSQKVDLQAPTNPCVNWNQNLLNIGIKLLTKMLGRIVCDKTPFLFWKSCSVLIGTELGTRRVLTCIEFVKAMSPHLERASDVLALIEEVSSNEPSNLPKKKVCILMVVLSQTQAV